MVPLCVIYRVCLFSVNQSPFLLSKRASGPYTQSKQPIAVASELPRVLHHDLEVVVTIDRAAHTFVIFAELFKGDDSVGLLSVPLGHELLEDLFGTFLALFYLGVLTGIIQLSDVLEGHAAILGHIELVVCSSDPNLASIV